MNLGEKYTDHTGETKEENLKTRLSFKSRKAASEMREKCKERERKMEKRVYS